jgi:alkylation response protein AidB-like acyl-CoA dehydrogenase
MIRPGAPAHPAVAAVRDFVATEVVPVARDLDHADRYPHALVARLRELGLFGCLIPPAYGGLGLDVTTYARVIEELCRGWMSLAGVINSHTMMALIVLHHGTDAQRQRFLPRFARGEARGGLCLTEPHAGSDVQAIRTVARRDGDRYLITGTKMFVTNGREGNAFALLALTDRTVEPRHRGMSCFIVEKGHPGLRVAKSIGKLGYKGVDTAELVFEDFAVPAASLVGEVEGRGFRQVMSGLETGRINIAARAVGVGQAAFDAARARVRSAPEAPVALADMATRLVAARLLTSWSAGMKDRGERCDLEAGMAKLYASEAAQEIALAAMRLHGLDGQLAASPVERHYRDAPLMIIGEGTNEIQRLVVARNLLERHGERPGALTSLAGEPDERRQMLLTVRQFVEKIVIPAVPDHEATGRAPAGLLRELADLGVLGAILPVDQGGLDLDLVSYAMILEELARGWASLAALVHAHVAAARVVARCGTPRQRERLLPPMARGDLVGALAGSVEVAVLMENGRRLRGRVPAVDNAVLATVFLVPCAHAGGRVTVHVVPREREGVTVDPPAATLGHRALGIADLHLDGVETTPEETLGAGKGTWDKTDALATGRLGAAAIAVGVAGAAFEAALRYSQQRSAFGKPICQHQAIQLKLADMATRTTAARLLTSHAAALVSRDGADGMAPALAKLYTSEVAAEVTLEAMRVHGGYGYTTEFPVERFYRDAARLLVAPTGNDEERRQLGAWLASPAGALVR